MTATAPRSLLECILDAASRSVRPAFTLFAHGADGFTLLSRSTSAVEIADAYVIAALNGRDGLEIRCDGVRVQL